MVVRRTTPGSHDCVSKHKSGSDFRIGEAVGTDPWAMLYYGISITPPDEYGSEPELRADRYDLEYEWEQKHRPEAPLDRSDLHSQEWEDWRKRLQEWEASSQNVQIGFSGADDCERYFVHCAAMVKRVEWSEQLEITPEMLAPNPEADEWIKKFCEFAGVEYQQPKWYLAARYW